jgi:hypothetical protein
MPNEYLSAYAPMQSNAQYQQPQIMGQGSQEAMHQAMLQQQQQYNNQAANIAGSGNPYASVARGINPMLMAMALRQGGSGITEKGTGLGYDQNGQNPYSYNPQGPDFSQNFGNLISTRD